jgi:hypothetical protein
MTDEKLMVWDQRELCLYDLTIPEILGHFDYLKEKYGTSAHTAKAYPKYGKGPVLVLRFQREETELEFINRRKAVEAQEAQK